MVVACFALACGSVGTEEAVQLGCETQCEYRLACLFDSPAGVPACAMECPDRIAAASGDCRDAYEALGRCVAERDEVECPGFLAGFCSEAFELVASECHGGVDGGMLDGAVVDGGDSDLGPLVDMGPPIDMGAPMDMGCEPATCESVGAECGTIANSCGGDPIDCPACEGGLSCDGNSCVSECNPSRSVTREASMAASVGADGREWRNPEFALATADGSSASANLRFMESSQDLTLTGWGFALPADATVDGIEVSIIRSAAGNTADDAIQLTGGGGTLGSPKTVSGNWPSTPAAQRYGGAADTWGASPSRTQVNGAAFGVAIRARHANGSPSSSEVEHVTMTVHYSVSCP